LNGFVPQARYVKVVFTNGLFRNRSSRRFPNPHSASESPRIKTLIEPCGAAVSSAAVCTWFAEFGCSAKIGDARSARTISEEKIFAFGMIIGFERLATRQSLSSESVLSSSLLLCDRRLGPAFGRFRKFPRGKTPDDNFLFCEVSGVFQTAPIKIQTHRRRSRAARADEVGSESELLRNLIHQTGVLREKIVKDERMTVAEKKHRAICIRLDRRTGLFT